MKKLTSILSLFAIAVLFTFCTTDRPVQIVDEAEQIRNVAAAVEDFKTAIISADRDLLENIASDKLVFGHSGGKVQNKAEFIEELVSLIPNDYQAIDMADQTIMVSGNTAIVRHIYSADYLSDGVPGSLRVGNVLVWQEQDGKWKLIARQAYRL